MLNRISVNGTELEYQLRGTGAGEPVVLIHWGVAATWAEPLLDQPALASRYQLLSYHRAGFAGSGRLQGPPAMAAHAAHCHQLMRELGITRAHIVGHSSSVPVALQLALDAPEAVHTLTLMEAARPAAPTDSERQFGTERRPGRPPALPRGRQGRSGRHLLPRRPRTRLPYSARPRTARRLRAGSRRRRRVLHPGNTCHPAVAVHRRRRAPHPAASARRPRDSQPPDVRRTAQAAAALAAQRRATRPARPHPSPARAGPRRRGRRTRRLLRPPPDRRATLTRPPAWRQDELLRTAPTPHEPALAIRTERTDLSVIKVRARTTTCHPDRVLFAAQLKSYPCLEMPARSALADRLNAAPRRSPARQ